MANLRPIQTFYDGNGRIAYSTTPHKAAIAAFRRILTGDYKYASIYRGKQHIASVYWHVREIPGEATGRKHRHLMLAIIKPIFFMEK